MTYHLERDCCSLMAETLVGISVMPKQVLCVGAAKLSTQLGTTFTGPENMPWYPNRTL